MLRINRVNYKKDEHTEDKQPSSLFTLFTSANCHDPLKIIASHASPADMANVKQTCRAANQSINSWLDYAFTDPVELLKTLSRLDKVQISRLLQQYFPENSPYFKKLKQQALARISPAAYACYALCADPLNLDLDLLYETIIWLNQANAAPHIIDSIQITYEFLNQPDDDEDEDEFDLAEYIEDRPDAYINLQNCDLSHLNLNQLDLRGANFQYANFSESTFNEAQLDFANFSHAKLRYSWARRASMCNTKFQFANLTKANIWGSDFSNADMKHCDLRDANMVETTLANTCLQGAILKHVRLNDANARGADFSGCDLTLANLQFADLANANLHRAKLAGTIFFSTNLANARLPDNTRSVLMPFCTLTESSAEPAQKMRKR